MCPLSAGAAQSRQSTLRSQPPITLLPLQSASSYCLSASPFHARNSETNATAKKKRIGIVQMQKWYDQCPKSNRKGEGSKRESAFVSQQIQSIEAKQVLFLIMPTVSWSAVWKSGYTSLEKQRDKEKTLIHTFPKDKVKNALFGTKFYIIFCTKSQVGWSTSSLVYTFYLVCLSRTQNKNKKIRYGMLISKL